MEELEAYIVDKATAQGLSCTATVTCRQQDEIYLPDTVMITVTGVMTEEEQDDLTQMIVEDFSISETKISVITDAEEGVG